MNEAQTKINGGDNPPTCFATKLNVNAFFTLLK